MQDEQFIRDWTAVHEDFTADLQGTLSQFGAPRREATCVIGPAYDDLAEPESRTALSPAARASLRGLAASVITLALWVIVMLVATPAPGLAASPEVAVQACDCAGCVTLA